MATGSRNDINVRIGVDQAALTAGLQTARGAVDRAAGGMSSGFRGVAESAGRAGEAIRRTGLHARTSGAAFDYMRGRLGALVSVYAAWRAATASIRAADQMSLINSRMSSLIGTTEGAAQATDDLFRIAQRLQVPYAGLGDAFARMYPAIQQMNGGIEETVQLSEILAITARLSGAGTAEATSAQIQFAQALGSGVLQGEELKSILENNNTLARALADGLEVEVTRLKDMGKQGELTADRVARALLGQYDTLKARSEEIALTVGGAWDTVGNSFARLAEQMGNSSGVLGFLVAGFRGLAQTIEAISSQFRSAENAANGLTQRAKIEEWAAAAARSFAIFADAVTVLTTGIRGLMTAQIAMLTALRAATSFDFSGAWDAIADGAQRVADIVAHSAAILRGEAGTYAEVLKLQAGAGSSGGSGSALGQLGGVTVTGDSLAWKDDPDRQIGRDMARRMGEERAAMLRNLEQHRQIQTTWLSVTQARIADEIDAEQEAAQAQRASGEINAAELFALQADFEQRRLALSRAVLAEKLAILESDPEMNPAERARILAEIEQLEIEHGARMRGHRAQLAQESSAFGQQFWSGLQNGIVQFANGIAQGTIRIGNIWRTMWQGLVQITFSALTQIGARWLVTQLQAMMGARSSAVSQVSANAAVAGSAAVASAAAIPVYGWAMAPAAGAAAFTAAMGYGAALAIPSAALGFDVPAGLNPVTQLHEREMVLPQKYADAVRSMAEGGAQGGTFAPKIAIAAMDGADVERVLMRNPDALERALRKVARKGGYSV